MIREWIDKLLLSDHEWKKKYCPYLYYLLFEMPPEERSKLFDQRSGIDFPSFNAKCLIDDINKVVVTKDDVLYDDNTHEIIMAGVSARNVHYFWDETHHLT